MKDLAWYDKLHWLALMMMAAAMPFSYNLGLWAVTFVAIASLIKIIVTRRVGNPALPKLMRWECISIIVYWLLCLVSMLYTSNVEEGWSSMRIKSSLIILPLSILLCDTGYLKEKYLRGFGYSIVCAVSVVFIYFLCKAFVNVSGDMSVAKAFSTQFDTRHHSYVAIYVVMSLLFVLYELKNSIGTAPRWLMIALIAYSAIGVLYIEIVNSRAGVLGLYLLESAAVVLMIVKKRKWWNILLVTLLIGGYTFAVEKTLPGHTNRIELTIKDQSKEVPTDARMKIYKSSFELSKSSLFFGYGVGDYQELLDEVYASNDFFPSNKLNAHNQYLECLLGMGLLGCIPMLFFLLSPAVYVLRKKLKVRPYIYVAVATVMLNLLFESMLERLMGVLFITLIYMYIVVTISCEENNFVRNEKKDVPLHRF